MDYVPVADGQVSAPELQRMGAAIEALEQRRHSHGFREVRSGSGSVDQPVERKEYWARITTVCVATGSGGSGDNVSCNHFGWQAINPTDPCTWIDIESINSDCLSAPLIHLNNFTLNVGQRVYIRPSPDGQFYITDTGTAPAPQGSGSGSGSGSGPSGASGPVCTTGQTLNVNGITQGCLNSCNQITGTDVNGNPLTFTNCLSACGSGGNSPLVSAQ